MSFNWSVKNFSRYDSFRFSWFPFEAVFFFIIIFLNIQKTKNKTCRLHPLCCNFFYLDDLFLPDVDLREDLLFVRCVLPDADLPELLRDVFPDDPFVLPRRLESEEPA